MASGMTKRRRKPLNPRRERGAFLLRLARALTGAAKRKPKPVTLARKA